MWWQKMDGRVSSVWTQQQLVCKSYLDASCFCCSRRCWVSQLALSSSNTRLFSSSSLCWASRFFFICSWRRWSCRETHGTKDVIKLSDFWTLNISPGQSISLWRISSVCLLFFGVLSESTLRVNTLGLGVSHYQVLCICSTKMFLVIFFFKQTKVCSISGISTNKTQLREC